MTFERFVLWEETGPDLKKHAPRLFRYMFEDRHVRFVLSRSLPFEVQKEVQRLLMLVDVFHSDRPSRVFEPARPAKHKCVQQHEDGDGTCRN